ncbi:MAG: phage holin [Eubacteriaceae bacterium]|nr:phage holin [Eubacteriaceae bacterium]
MAIKNTKEKSEKNITEELAAVKITDKKKSIGFWIGILGVILATTGHAWTDFTTWPTFGQWFIEVFRNPATIIGIVLAVYGAWNNPTTKGIN